MIGFNTKIDPIGGMQVLLDNGYGVTVATYTPSKDPGRMFGACVIVVAKIASVLNTTVEDCVTEDVTLEIMKGMGYKPNIEEQEREAFIDVNISKFFEVVEYCSYIG
jgi:hypothetical protein